MQMLTRGKRERGAIIIHVAFALLALIAFTAFVVDMGVMWVSRGQAQNAADAGALAGAVSLMRDGGSTTEAAKSALQWTNNNTIFGAANTTDNVRITFSGASGTCGPSCDISPIPPCGDQPGCVRSDVFRWAPDRPYRSGATLGAPIPTFFGPLIGITQQRVRATATAEMASGNMVKCMLPFAVADRWADFHDEQVASATDGLPGTAGWTSNDFYEDALGGHPAPYDSYTPPYHPGHTGWTVSGDYGRQLVLKDASPSPDESFSAGWTNLVNLPGSTGGSDIMQEIRGCNPTPVGIAKEGDDCSGYPPNTTTLEAAKAGCLSVGTGVSQGNADHGIESGPRGDPGPLTQQDDDARWSWTVPGPDGLMGSVVDANGAPNMSSPRIRPVAIFDITSYMQNAGCRSQAGTGCVAKVVNIIGFFVEGMCDTVQRANQLDPGVTCDPSPAQAKKQVVGRIVTLPASFAAGAGEVEENASFLKVIRLVR